MSGGLGQRLYRTGDLARWLPGGDLEFRGRIDHQVKVRGFRIELGEIETTLARYPSVREAVVVATASGRLEAYLVAHQPQPSEKELLDYLYRNLPEYMVPVEFAWLEELPSTPTGKVDRQSLVMPAHGTSEPGRRLAPRDELELKLTLIWQELLGRRPIAVDENFFKLGGNSLLAVRLMVAVEGSLGVRLPLSSIFETPTIAELARFVRHGSLTDEQSPATPPIVPVPRESPLPLSFAQQRLWFLDQLHPNEPSYNIPAVVRLAGPLRVAALSASFQEIVRRHEALRTSFQRTEAEPVQVISPAAEPGLIVVDLRSLPKAARERQADNRVLTESRRPFDLGRGPLLRGYLVRLSEEEHLALFVMHHIISDAWSIEIFIRELTALYKAFSHAEPSPLPELAIQYADFASWQRAWLQGEVLSEQLAYWHRQLDGVEEALDLPTDRPRPRILSSYGGELFRQLSPGLSARLKDLSVEGEATLFMTLLAAYSFLLSRYSSQREVVVGSPIANRNHVEIENLIGFFVNTLAFRVVLSRGGDFHQLLGQVRRSAFGAYQHQDLPFEKLIDEIGVERTLERTPLFQAFLAFQSEPSPAPEFPDLSLTSVAADTGTTKFDLTLVAAETAGGLALTFKFNRDLFDRSTVARMTRHFETLLTEIVEEPETELDELAMMSPAERFQLFEEWNDVARQVRTDDSSAVFHQLFSRQARTRGDAPAIRQGEEVWSYRELDEWAERLVAHLFSPSLSPEFRVGLHLRPSPALVASVLATFKAGGAFVPLDPSLPEARLRFMVEDAGIDVVLSSDDSPQLPCDLAEKVIRLDVSRETLPAVATRHRHARASELAYVIYTSGSTGRPKGVMVDHRSLLNYLHWIRGVLYDRGTCRLPAITPLAFDASLKQLLAPLMSGAEVWLPRAPVTERPELLLREIRESPQPVAINCVPSLWTALLDRLELEGGRLNGRLRRLFVGGESLSPDLVERTLKALPDLEIWNLYGPSEATANATAGRVLPGRPVSLGRPIANARVTLLNRRLDSVALGQLGELCLSGPGLTRGYLGRAQLTARKLVPNALSGGLGQRLYRTGDLARWLPGGDLEFRGRIDHQVKVRGFRIELGEIETTLARYPSVREAVVVATASGRLEAYLVAHQPQPSEKELLDYLYRNLPEYMVPVEFAWLEELPSTPTGKVDRQSLVMPAHGTSEPGRRLAPRDELELKLTLIWQELLGRRPIAVDENFFKLGGNSLLAVRLMVAVEGSLGVRLPLSSIFETPTVERLANGLRKQARRGADSQPDTATQPGAVSPLVALQPDGHKRPFFCIHPVGGNVFCYMELAQSLGSEQPFYGIQSVVPNLAGHESESSIEAMAAGYLEVVRKVQPAGPYALGGWSMGAGVAFEMARQLETMGEEVALLAMIDSGAPGAKHPSTNVDETLLMARFAEDLVGLSASEQRTSLDDLRSMGLDKGLDRLLEHARAEKGLWAAIDSVRIRELFEIFRRNSKSLSEYVPRSYGGHLVYFSSEEKERSDNGDVTRGWKDLCRGSVEVHVIPGDHYSILKEPNVEVLSKRLSESLERRWDRMLRKVKEI